MLSAVEVRLTTVPVDLYLHVHVYVYKTVLQVHKTIPGAGTAIVVELFWEVIAVKTLSLSLSLSLSLPPSRPPSSTPHTAHITQMVWEQNVAVIVMLTSFTDMGLVRKIAFFLSFILGWEGLNESDNY